MGRNKKNPNLPSGLTMSERYNLLKDLGLCVKCGINTATTGLCCDICHAKELDRGRRRREEYKSCKIKRKTIQAKQDYFDFCIEQANKLKISYGEYMVLKSRGENNANFNCL